MPDPLAMAMAIPISVVLVAMVMLILDIPDDYQSPQIQHRFDRHDELSRTWVEFVAEHGRAPTTNELWALAPPDIEE